MINIVLHSILLQSFECHGVYIRPSEMLLRNQRRMMPCAKIAIQIPKRYIYLAPLRVLLTTIAPSGLVKITFEVRQGILPANEEPLHL